MKDNEIIVMGRLSSDLKSLEITHADKVSRLLAPLQDEDLEISIKKFYKRRTAAQNRWIWGVCIPQIITWMKNNEGTAPSKEALYTYLRTHVVGQEIVLEQVGEHEVPILKGKRFSQMTTKEFSDAVDKIVDYYAERGLEINLPKDDNVVTDF